MIGAGSWGTAVAVLLARGGLEVQLGTRTAEQAERDRRASARTSATCPACALPEAIAVKRAARDRARRLRPGLPRGALGGAAAARSARSPTGSARAPAVLLLTKGLVAAAWARCPTEYVAERVRGPRDRLRSAARPTPARPRRDRRRWCSARADADLRAQLGEVFDRAGLVCERTDDVVGVEMAGAAKNAAALAAAAAEPHGLNAAGIAAAEIWRECVELRARARRASSRPSPGSPGSAT